MTNLKNRNHILTLALLIILPVLAACAQVPGGTPVGNDATQGAGLPPKAALEAQRWLANRLEVQPGTIDIKVTEQAEWQDSCLGLGGPDEACLQVITPGWRFVLVQNGDEYEIRTDEDGTEIRMVPAGDTQNEAGRLLDTRWQLESFSTPGDETSGTAPLPDTTITLFFDPEGQAGGQSGCNIYNAHYATLEDRLSFEQMTSTEIACIPEVMAQETRFLEALQTAETYRLAGDKLTIFYDSETKTLNFTRMVEIPPDSE